MIKKLRLNFILISMSALVILILAIFISINMFMEKKALEQVDRYLNNVIQLERREQPNNVVAPLNTQGDNIPPIEPLVEGFALRVDESGSINKVEFNDNELSLDEMNLYISEVLERSISSGEIGNYRYRYKKVGDGYFIVFADSSVQIEILNQLLKISYLISFISFIVLFILILFLSNYVVKPVSIAFEKQKRFISDSSHELKTPLSILLANLDMLEKEVENNKRISTIRDSAVRMNELIHSLLVLARTEQKKQKFEVFDLSRLVESSALSFEVIAFEHSNNIKSQIEDGLKFKGNKAEIAKMLDALIENAIKYSWKNTDIIIKLSSKGSSKIIEVYNEGIGIKKENLSKIFDKFFREDDSRTRNTGSYGIGLSIVKNIVENHKGKLSVDSISNKYSSFKIIL